MTLNLTTIALTFLRMTTYQIALGCEISTLN